MSDDDSNPDLKPADQVVTEGVTRFAGRAGQLTDAERVNVMTTREIAERCGVSIRTAQRWKRDGIPTRGADRSPAIRKAFNGYSRTKAGRDSARFARLKAAAAAAADRLRRRAATDEEAATRIHIKGQQGPETGTDGNPIRDRTVKVALSAETVAYMLADVAHADSMRDALDKFGEAFGAAYKVGVPWVVTELESFNLSDLE